MARDGDNPPSKNKPSTAPADKKFKYYAMEWGFVMCYVGGHNVQQVEDRITSVEECLDGFLGESKDGDDGKGSGVSAELRKTDKRVEQAEATPDSEKRLYVHGYAIGIVFSRLLIDDKQAKQNKMRRKPSAGKHNASKHCNAIRAVDDRLDPEIAVVRRKPISHMICKIDAKN
ncbi:MAG: hypothetical protein LQ337_008473 [Flavoplaca oasis]|nr:MAG: hypothetical protein LQ337_008473 [Flavoplaca oasis]